MIEPIEKKKSSKLKTVGLVLGGIVSGFLLLGIIGASMGGASDASTTTKPEAVVTTTVADTTVTEDTTVTTVAEAATTTTAAVTTTTEDPTAGEPDGSLNNPFPVGTTVIGYDEWEVTYLGAHIGTDEVMAENMFNEPPRAGFEYVMLEFKAKFIGEESGEWWLDTRVGVVGGANNTFDENCGVIADHLWDAGETFTGAKIRGFECIEVKVNQLDGARVYVEESTWFGDNLRGFFELGL